MIIFFRHDLEENQEKDFIDENQKRNPERKLKYIKKIEWVDLLL